MTKNNLTNNTAAPWFKKRTSIVKGKAMVSPPRFLWRTFFNRLLHMAEVLLKQLKIFDKK
jgi:hypothetical protein